MRLSYDPEARKRRIAEIALWDHPDDPRHGTANGYTNLDCRCDRCRDAWRVAHWEWMHADLKRMQRHAWQEATRRTVRKRLNKGAP